MAFTKVLESFKLLPLMSTHCVGDASLSALQPNDVFALLGWLHWVYNSKVLRAMRAAEVAAFGWTFCARFSSASRSVLEESCHVAGWESDRRHHTCVEITVSIREPRLHDAMLWPSGWHPGRYVTSRRFESCSLETVERWPSG